MDNKECFLTLCENLNSNVNLSELWFSDRLAFYLNPDEKHGLGKKFCYDFLKMMIENRKRAGQTILDSQLRIGKGKKGETLSSRALQNIGVVREFYLQKGQYLDLVLLNLNRNQQLVVIIENKYLTSNSEKQLSTYRKAMKELLPTSTIFETIYLTLKGDGPKTSKESTQSDLKHWVSMSWFDHVLPLLKKHQQTHSELYKALFSLKALSERQIEAEHYIHLSLKAYAEYILEELNRRSENWVLNLTRKSKYTFYFQGPVNRSIKLSYHSGSHLKIMTSTTKGSFNRSSYCSEYILPLGLSTLASLSFLQTLIRKVVMVVHGDKEERRLLSDKKQVSVHVQEDSDIKYINRYFHVFKFLNHIK